MSSWGRSSRGAAARARSYDSLATLRACLEPEAAWPGRRPWLQAERRVSAQLWCAGSRKREPKLCRPISRGGDLTCDVRSSEQVEAAVAETVERLGGLDTLICNAGRTVVGRLHELPEEDWDDGFDINLKGIYRCVRSAWPHLATSGGTITSTASVVGIWASEGQAAYCATKAGVIMLTKCLALEGAREGIRANCVLPGLHRHAPSEDIHSAARRPCGGARGRCGAASRWPPRNGRRHRRVDCVPQL